VRAPVTDVDVAIVGGGVAGAAAALTLRRYTTLSVAIFERTSYDRARTGEQISVEAAPLLDYLGVDEDALLRGHLAGGIPLSAWDATGLREEPTAFGGAARAWFLDRARFDRTLADEARRCGTAFPAAGRIRSATFDRTARRWELHADGPLGGERWRARGLVDAGGSGAPIARRLGTSFVADDALYAVVGRLRGAAPRLRNLVVEASPDGWWYAVRVPGDVLVVTFLTDLATMRRERPAQPDRWGALLARTRHVARLIGEGEPAALETVFVPSRRLAPPAGSAWIAAGDAAMATDPLAGMGIGFALHSGACAARALAAELKGDPEPARAYAERLAATFDTYCAIRRALYGNVARWRDRPFWLGRGAVVARS